MAQMSKNDLNLNHHIILGSCIFFEIYKAVNVKY